MKARIYHFDKETGKRDQRSFDQVYRDLDFITRADDPSKLLPAVNVRLLTNLITMVKNSANGLIRVDQDFVSDITKKKRHQNVNFFKQLKDIFDFEYCRAQRFEGIRYSRFYFIKFTKDGEARVDNPELFYNVGSAKNSLHKERKFTACGDKIHCTILREIKKEEREEEPLGYSSSLSLVDVEKRARGENGFSKEEADDEKKRDKSIEPIEEFSTLAAGYLKKPAKVTRLWERTRETDGEDEENQENEVRSFELSPTNQAAQVVKQQQNQQLDDQQQQNRSWKKLTAKEERAIHLQRMRRDHDGTENSSLMQMVSKLVNCNINPKKTTEMKFEKVPEVKNEENKQSLLLRAIFNAFGESLANEIRGGCEFSYLSPEKMLIKLKQGFQLDEHRKAKIRSCVRSVYGENVKIVSQDSKQRANVSSSVEVRANQRQIEAKDDQEQMQAVVQVGQTEQVEKIKHRISNVSHCFSWSRFKNSLAKVLRKRYEEKDALQIIERWYDKLEVVSELNNEKLVVVGKDFFVSWIYQNYERFNEEAVLDSGVDIEIRYESNMVRPIVISKELIGHWEVTGKRWKEKNE